MRIVYILMLCCLTGCYSGESPKRSQAEKDRQALEMFAIVANASQTNWTVVVLARVPPRTNH